MIAFINLLPWRSKIKQKHRQIFICQIGAMFFIASFILVAWRLVLERKINRVEREIKCHQKHFVKSSTQNTQAIATQQYLQMQRDLIGARKLQKQKEFFVRLIENIQQGLLANTYLTELIINKEGAQVFGKSGSILAVITMLRKLNAREQGREFVLDKIIKQDMEYEFHLLLTLEQET